MIEIFFDGACTPVNPGGVGSWGFVLKDDVGGELLQYGICGNGEPSTNNVAEYYGLIRGLHFALINEIKNQKIKVFGDSALVCNMANGTWGKKDRHKKAPHLIPLLDNVQALIFQLKCRGNVVSIQWIPREKNTEADKLTKQAYKEYESNSRK